MFDLLTGRILATQERWLALQQKLQFLKNRDSCTVRQFMSLIGHRETGLVSEAHTVAPETTLARPGGFGKDYPNTQISPPTSRLVVRRETCIPGSAIPSPRPRSTNVYRRLKRRLGRTLRGLHCKRHVVRHRKSPPCQFPGVKSSISGPQELRASLQGPDCVGSNGQHNCSILHQQRGRYEIRLSVCPPLEASVLVPPQGNSPEGKTHPRLLECDSRQIVQTQASDSDRVVPISTGVKSLFLQMGPTTAGPFCDPV